MVVIPHSISPLQLGINELHCIRRATYTILAKTEITVYSTLFAPEVEECCTTKVKDLYLQGENQFILSSRQLSVLAHLIADQYYV